MATTTAEQAFELADGYRRTADAMTSRLLDSWAELEASERATMQAQAGALLAAAIEVRVRAMGLLLDEVEASVTVLLRATSKANAAIKALDSAKGVIRVSTAVLAVAGAIGTQNPGAVAGTLAALLKELEG